MYIVSFTGREKNKSTCLIFLMLAISAQATAQGAPETKAAIAKKEVIIDKPTLADARRLWLSSPSQSEPAPEQTSDDPYGDDRGFDDKGRLWTSDPNTGAIVRTVVAVREGTAINFYPGSAKVRSDDIEKIRPYAKALAENPARKLLVVGHTDSTGRRVTNILLSNRRAEAVKQVLIDLGVQPEQIRTLGKGPDDPNPTFADNDPRQRRVEFEGQ